MNLEQLIKNHQGSKFPFKSWGNVLDFLNNKKRPFTYELEQTFAKKMGTKYAIALNSGTSALHACLAAVGAGPGDEVISPALTVIMDTFATLYVGAKPVYADILPGYLTLDWRDVLRKTNNRTKAIIAVSLYGLPNFVQDRDIPIIEDNAQCLTSPSRVAFKVYSFERSKHLGIGEGGMVTTDNEMYAERIRKFAGLGYKNLAADAGRMQTTPVVFQDPDYFRHDSLGYNYRMPEICAALALGLVDQIDEIIKRRQDIAKLYDQAIKGCDWMTPQESPSDEQHSYWTYAVRYEGPVPWKEFYTRYNTNGGDGFYAAWQLPYQELGLEHTPCPVAEELQPKLMQFKTNYRDMDLAGVRTEALRRTIEELS